MGIDQLNFHSAQLGYLKLLQMGNADPNKTKAGNKYEVKPQYEERTKQINMQHAINQCYECMRLSKLQRATADPKKTKAGNKYEVKPQYEERTKQINMQHAINQCYECMRLSKEISQLGRCNNRQIISCRLYTTVYQPGNHRSVIIGARQPITARW
ncbi:hypothetical protein F511_42598 [Dorcoceras hygrometricum]|uniref:Uncharacterized protein n=1 Tax=Dorcoceras hygrometricum TaxID=472368 RepID=A0A2Z7CSS1_9LAMI|nr:hypothetical protein F511_42598 [Dorcoceras hygrometricum]